MNAILNAITTVWNTAGWILKCFHLTCLWIGWAITTAYLCMFRGILALGINFLHAVSILCEDFLIFLEDFGEVVDKSLTDTIDATWLLVESLNSACRFLVAGVIHSPSFILQGVMSFKIGRCCLNLACLVKDAILLIGIWIWEVFAFAFAALSYLNEAPYIVCILIARALDRLVFSVLTTIETNLFKSICGLCIGYGAVFAAKNSGLMPEESTGILISRVYKWSVSKIMAAAHLLMGLCRTAGLKLKSVVVASFIFILHQSQTVKNFGREIFREAVTYTPTKAALQIKLEKETAAMQCVVCMDRRRDVMTLNCRHLTMCRTCAITVAVNTGECPVCRSPIDNIISVYT